MTAQREQDLTPRRNLFVSLKALNCRSEISRHLYAFLFFQRITNHHCRATTDNRIGFYVDGTLLQGETLSTDTRDAGFYNDLISIKDGMKKICTDIGYNRHNTVCFPIGTHYRVEVVHLTQVVIAEIRIIIDVTVRICVIKTYLYWHSSTIRKLVFWFFHTLIYSRCAATSYASLQRLIVVVLIKISTGKGCDFAAINYRIQRIRINTTQIAQRINCIFLVSIVDRDESEEVIASI